MEGFCRVKSGGREAHQPGVSEIRLQAAESIREGRIGNVATFDNISPAAPRRGLGGHHVP